MMKTCLNCNNPVDDDAEFCGSCGAKLERETEVIGESTSPNAATASEDVKTSSTNGGEQGNKEEVPPPKKKMSPATLGMIAVAGVLVIGLAIFFAVSGSFSNPANKFLSYQRDFATKQVAPYIQKSLKETETFSTDMVLTAAVKGANSEEYNQYLKDSAVTMKVDMQKDSLLTNAELKLMGSTLLQATITCDKDNQLGFYLPELDSKYYTVDLPTVMKELGGADLSFKKMQETQESYSQICKEFGKLYLEVILGEVNKNNVSVTDKEKVELKQLGKTVKGTVYTYQPSQEDIKNIIIKLSDSLEKNTELKKHIINVVQTNETLMDDLKLKDGQTIEEAVDQYLKEGISGMRDHAEEWSKNLADQHIRWCLGVSQGRIVQQCLKWDQSDSVIGYESDGTTNDGRHDVCYASIEGEVVQLDAQWKKANGTYSGEIALGDNQDTYCKLKFDNANPGTESALEIPYGNYHLSFEAPDLAELSDCLVDLTVQKGSTEGTDHIMHLKMPSESEFPEMDITLHTTDKKSTAQKPSVEASKINSADELDTVMNAMSEKLGGLLLQLMGSSL